MRIGQDTVKLTMYVTLALVRLSDEQVRDVAANVILVANGVTSKNLLQPVKVVSEGLFLSRGLHLHPGIHQCTVAVLPLDHANHFWRHLALIF